MGKLTRWGFGCLCTLLLISCGEDGIVGTGLNIKGVVQKGPFVRGSQVTFYNYYTGVSAQTETKDSLGNFDFSPEQDTFYIISCNGYYFNEIIESISSQPLNLYAYYLADDVSDQFLGVNLLTDLAFRRIDAQLRSGVEPATAIAEAQDQLVLAINGIMPNQVSIANDFTSMSVYNLEHTDEIENTFLLFFSAVTYQAALIAAEYNSEMVDSRLQALLSSLAFDVASGNSFSEANKTALIEASRKLNPDKIARILQRKSLEVLGEILPVPDINIFLDTDGDGVANSLDNDDDGDGIPDSEDSNPYDG